MTKAWFIRHFPRDDAMTGRALKKTVSLALQGGGAHGAFTWGVLDALLEDGRLAVEAISGASAGATATVRRDMLGQATER